VVIRGNNALKEQYEDLYERQRGGYPRVASLKEGNLIIIQQTIAMLSAAITPWLR